MYNKLFPAITIAIALFFESFILSDNPVEHINRVLNTFFEKYPQEKVYLQFDKQQYTGGDTIWYKGYITYKNAPSSISKVLYVEFIDENGKILRRQILPVAEGMANGNITLDGQLSSGIFYIRSYTAWMMNFDPSFYFYDRIPVGQQDDQDTQSQSADSTSCFVQFFPEGGGLVSGLTSLVAFKAIDHNGLPENISGKIIDSSGKQLAELRTVHDGMGSFIIHPMAGNNYSAVIDLPQGRIRIPLPKISTSGIVFHTETVNGVNEDSVYFRISRSIQDKNLYQHLIICAQTEGLSDFTYINFDDETAGNYNNTILTAPSPLSVEQFPPGILHLTIFNESGEVLAQRLIFLKSNHRTADIDLHPSELDFSPHAKNTFVLKMAEPISNYSVSVTDADAEKESTDHENIISDILLTSDLKNHVKDPGWYFEKDNAQNSKALDLLMMTCQWSRFSWDDIMANRFPHVKYYAEQSLVLKGRAFSVKNKVKKPLSEGELPLMIREQNGALRDIVGVPTDSSGYFTLTGLDFYDSATIMVKNTAETKKHRDVDISVHFENSPLDSIRYAFIPGLSEKLTGRIAIAGNLPVLNKKKVSDSLTDGHRPPARKIKTLDTVTVRAKVKTHLDSVIANYATGVFAAPNDGAKTFDFTNDPATRDYYNEDIVHYLEGKVPGLRYQWTENKDTKVYEPLLYWGMTTGLFLKDIGGAQFFRLNAPALFLNEQELSEGSEGYDQAIYTLLEVKMADVELVRVFEPGTMPMVSGDAPHGAIAIYTKNGSESMLAGLPMLFNKMKKAGFTQTRDFSSPDYALKKNLETPDNRTTLYWNPQLVTDSVSHTASFSFYNNDVTKRFHIIIEGVDKNGNIVRADKVFQ
jgi:hypothetical protein